MAHCLEGLSSARARSLPPSRLRSLLLPIESPQACQPARVRAGARQWQRYHVTSTPPLPHLKKANCIERHRCHRRPPPSPVCSVEASFGSPLSASPLWMNVHSIGGTAGAGGQAGGRMPPPRWSQWRGRQRRRRQSFPTFIRPSCLPPESAGRTERSSEREGGNLIAGSQRDVQLMMIPMSAPPARPRRAAAAEMRKNESPAARRAAVSCGKGGIVRSFCRRTHNGEEENRYDTRYERWMSRCRSRKHPTWRAPSARASERASGR